MGLGGGPENLGLPLVFVFIVFRLSSPLHVRREAEISVPLGHTECAPLSCLPCHEKCAIPVIKYAVKT